jgi:valyl-tRNA synthetase
MGGDETNLLATQLAPKPMAFDKAEAAKFEEVKSIVSEVRRIITALKLDKPSLTYDGEGATLIAKLANLSAAKVGDKVTGLKLTSAEAWLDISPQVIQNYIVTLNEQNQTDRALIERLEKRLNNHDYLSKAPKDLVDQTRAEKDKYAEIVNTRATEISRYEKSLER